MAGNILIVSPDPGEKKRIRGLLNIESLKLLECSHDNEALKKIKENDVSMVVISPLDNRIQGLKLKKKIQLLRPEVEVVLLDNFRTIRTFEDVLKHGASDYIVDLGDIRRLLIHFNRPRQSEESPDKEAEEVKAFFFDLTDLLLGILEVDDKYFSGNNHMVMRLVRKIAKRMGLDREFVDAVTLGSLLRDLGRIGIDQEILNKTGALTQDEFSTIKEHCRTSVKLLKRLSLPWRVDQVILQHHENYDGSGYPTGLKGREITIGARIVAVVDSYVAMTTDRPYRKAMEKRTAVQEIQQKAGTRYDPEVVEIFLQIIQEEWKKNADKKPRLLVVEDEQFMQTLIKLHMVDEGFEVMTAGNGAEAIKHIKQKKPDLIVSDVAMPLMDGLTLCRVLSQDPELKDIPFIFLSAYKEPNERVQGLKLGAIDYITKPFDLEELSLKINAVLKRDKRIRKDMTAASGINGRLEEMPFCDIVQFLNLGLKTAQVKILHEPQGEEGVVYLSRGEVTFAAAADLEGEEAFMRMLRWNHGRFTLRHGLQPKTVNISRSTMGLLMDGMKMIDEENRDHAAEPAVNGVGVD